ncbi:MAG: translation initiation factor IF-2 [Candidatus Omnitrophica bacterium]|nr:translation initiation factor IF-2 [Candidatus Omnitrophota bacterium]
MKIRELAKELKVTTAVVLETLKSLGADVKGPTGVIDDSLIKRLRSKLKAIAKPKSSKTAAGKKKVVKIKKTEIKKKKQAKGLAKKLATKKRARTPSKTVAKTATEVSKIVVEEVAKKPVGVAKEKPAIKPKKEEKKLPQIQVDFPVNVKELSVRLSEKSSSLIKKLMERKIFVNLNQSLDDELAKDLVRGFGYELKSSPTQEEKLLARHSLESKADLKQRHPVVTFMGHVDHGKTSILDYIRRSKLADREHGGITQHIGSYEVILENGKITFLDTPGHEAFTAMRARGATVTDIVVLVVAADDGVMPQTIEAINHAKAAGVPIIVAINKIDKAQENVNVVKGQLSKYDLASEDLGGRTVTVLLSAKTGQGIDQLLEMILLEAEMLELKANFSKSANGVVIEANLSKGRGVEVIILIQEGCLHLGDIVLVGEHFGKAKAMFDSLGKATSQAGPSDAVKLLGLSGVPQAGERFYVVDDEVEAREIVLKRKELKQRQKTAVRAHITLEDLHQRIQEGKVKELNIVLKADVQGSLEALKDSLTQLGTEEVKISLIHSGAGAINSSDVILAAASDAVVIGFHVEADIQAKEIAKREGVEIRTYRIIYEAIRELKAALEGLLEPKIKRKFLGRILIKKVFDLTKAGKVAGCIVQKGKIHRNNKVTLLRGNEKLFEGKISNLKRFKDDAREITEGMECGITLSGFNAMAEGDIIEAFEEEKIARKL